MAYPPNLRKVDEPILIYHDVCKLKRKLSLKKAIVNNSRKWLNMIGLSLITRTTEKYWMQNLNSFVLGFFLFLVICFNLILKQYQEILIDQTRELGWSLVASLYNVVES